MTKQKDLLKMLTYRRPAGSKTESDFIRDYIDVIPGIIQDQFGNRILPHPTSTVMIACHTDTVHKMEGRQKVVVSQGTAKLTRKSKSNCLGADDTAGIYAALRMIECSVPATFVFHRCEEKGGQGSSWLAEHYPEWLKGFDICLSLDRRGTEDIIVEQWGGECASELFAWSLSDKLGMGHVSAEGIFTDSANYTHLIPECSNLSIGYQHEHTVDETLDLLYLENVIEKLCKVDWTALTVSRVPTEPYTYFNDVNSDVNDAPTASRYASRYDGIEFTDEDNVLYWRA